MSSDVAAAIELCGLCRVLPSGGRMLTILDGIDLTVARGESVAVIGPSGSGKSTLLGLIAGLDRPSGGSVHIHGQRIDTMSEDRLARLRRGRIGFVFQTFQLLGNLTALENVALPLELTGDRRASGGARQLLEAVGLGERTHHYPSQLSGGEQQRVAVARAFSPDPDILLADEPTGNLDSATGRLVLDLLERLRSRMGTTMVLVTHDDEVASRAASRIYLRDGRIVVREAGEGAGQAATAGEGGGHDQPQPAAEAGASPSPVARGAGR